MPEHIVREMGINKKHLSANKCNSLVARSSSNSFKTIQENQTQPNPFTMRFNSISIALFASLALAAPSPSPLDATTSNLATGQQVQAAAYNPNVNCDASNIHCGTCNGLSCKIGYNNYPCDVGKCSKQSGGGDGKRCYDDAFGTSKPRHILCPGR
ncbi:uncharacterized protein BP01DRAFT_176539 [Aspergillus saccharolyticus JOP 1030-1]|uniref:Uncharacterized protein n=1 Tax=Aspergillus saccharolyticus JOP 1030-1 TaxID=1450539 RepID=A0A318ZN63_9EURO|nr:hypothetical protein BP01DRAFT_176539 [Aspergillus saccharolyticus JOP 1030-1]PYH48125.1 hypothetical protein BP01DRAFT_176539 [Aspergillus saccharolyticus JOP 1030-1]